MSKISLVIFTCEGREHLLKKSYASFMAACDHQFDQVILAIDGIIDTSLIPEINPDLVVYGIRRKGYVISIKNAIVHIQHPYFFWLEDDWSFHVKVDVHQYLGLLEAHDSWVEIVYSKYGPLTEEFKIEQLDQDIYQNINGYSTNPGFNRTSSIIEGFAAMDTADKMDGEKEMGFENFLTGYFSQKGLKCALIDPIIDTSISHEGYLESTPRNWHMMSSLEKKTERHLLIFERPSFARRLYMLFKLMKATIDLGFRQLFSDEIYELCFRIIALNISTKQSAKKTPGNHHSNG